MQRIPELRFSATLGQESKLCLSALKAREELSKRRSRGRDPERIWELRGVLRCPNCGSMLRTCTYRPGNKNGSERKHYYYLCRSRYDMVK